MSACGQIRNLDEMHDATADMRDQTREMNRQMKDMGSDTKAMGSTTKDMASQTLVLQRLSRGLDEKTAELYDLAKQGAALKAREDELNSLLAAQDPADKISRASKYFMSFEFQVWSKIGQDSLQRREELAAAGAREFMREVQGFIRPGQVSVDPFAVPHAGLLTKGFKGLEAIFGGDVEKIKALGNEDAVNREASLNALSVTLHILNRKQEELLAADPKLAEISMFSMIKEALTAKASIDSGAKKAEDFPVYVREILVYEDVAKLLLRARQNFLGVMALARVSKVREDQLQVPLMMKGPWTMGLEDLNVVSVREVTRYIKGAIQTQEFLISIGETPVLHPILKLLWSNAQLKNQSKDLKSAQPASAEANAVDVKTAAVNEFMDRLSVYLK